MNYSTEIAVLIESMACPTLRTRFFILSPEPGHTLDFFSNDVIQRKTKQMSSDILLEGKPLSFFDSFCGTTAENDLGERKLKQLKNERTSKMQQQLMFFFLNEGKYVIFYLIRNRYLKN